MSRYIDADELKKRINSRIGYFELYYPIDTANISELQNCLEIIDNAPTENVTPIIRGKWLNVSKVVRDDYLEDVNYAECSVCHSIRVADYFCSCCGADMRKMVESEKGE